MAAFQRTKRIKFGDQLVTPLLEKDLTEMTIPDKPNSTLQKYRLTQEGQKMREAGEV